MNFYYDGSRKVEGVAIAHEEFIDYIDDTYDVLGSVFLQQIDDFRQISEHTTMDDEYRWDMISYNHMKRSDYWWLLMEYNEHLDFNIKIGTKYKIPHPIDINRLKQYLIVRKNLERMT